MFIRVLTSLTVLCVLFVPAVRGEGPSAAYLDRRLGELEKQLGALLNQVKDLRKELQAAPPQAKAGLELKVFTLKHAECVDMTRLLQELFQGSMRVVADPRTNSVLIHAKAELMQAIEAIVSRLDEKPSSEKK